MKYGNQINPVVKFKILNLLHLLLLAGYTAFSQETGRQALHDNRNDNSLWLSYRNNDQTLYRIISNEAFRLLDAREEAVSKLETREEWEKHSQNAKNILCRTLEKFEKTPLKARTLGILERETFTVEKVIFESQPGFYVTAGLFLPAERQQPAPAIIYCCGHTELGFRSETYQQVILNLVSKGFIVLAFDPPGQGERLQYPDPRTGKSKIGGSTKEHSYAGIQTLMNGVSLSSYFIWDGIRVLDYLETRPEVDMTRIGITGRSGGGTQAAMIAACDSRIYAAAPENYITSFRRLLQSIGPQDAEQNPYNAIAGGFDHPDFLHIHAPKPALMLTTSNDFFSIQGARETFAEVKKSYAAMGHPGNIQMSEDTGGHQSTKKNRQALYAFFQKHLDLPGDSNDLQIKPFTLQELQVTPTGQVSGSFNSETVFSLNKKHLRKENPSENNLQAHVKDIAGIDPRRELTAAVFTGRFIADGVEVERYFLENDRQDYVLPVYILKNQNSSPQKLMVWFHPGGKEKIIGQPLLPKILNEGFTVLSADLPGTGELHDPDFSGDGTIGGITFNYTFGANLAGKSITGIQAEAIDLLVQFIKQKEQFENSSKTALVQGLAASPFLHFEVLNNYFKKAVFFNFPDPVANIVEFEYYYPGNAFYAVPGSLPYYDYPDLVKYIRESGTEIQMPENETEFMAD